MSSQDSRAGRRNRRAGRVIAGAIGMTAFASLAATVSMVRSSAAVPIPGGPLSAPFTARTLVPTGEAPFDLRFFTTAVKTDSQGEIVTGPQSDPVKRIVG